METIVSARADIPSCPEEPVGEWNKFHQQWGGLHNFLLDSRLTEFNYEFPPLERIIEEVRHDSHAIVRSGIKGDAFDLTEIKEAFLKLPLVEAMRSRFVLAHFGLHPHLTGQGQVFEGIDEKWVEPWRKRLVEHGFSFERVYAILFASGPHSASNFHMDKTHQLAWQGYGIKHFHGLHDPDKWTTAQERAACDLTMVKPDGIGDADVHTIVQPPGSQLWNTVAIPHWVETYDECAATLTLVHDDLRLHGELSPHSKEREETLRQVGAT